MSTPLLRRTKIVATLGPSTDDPAILEELVRAGVDVIRLNFSHGSLADHTRRIELVRHAARQAGRYVGVLGDLQGPKIRIDRFAAGKVMLKDGAEFTLDAALAPDAGTERSVGIAYKKLPHDVFAGDVLLLNDGQISLQVLSIDGPRIATRVVVGGELGNNKGINRQGGGLSAGALTDKDREDIRNAAQLRVDYLAVSFARDAADMEEARKLLRDAGGHGLLVAKIERAEAIKNLAGVVRASDGVMVARGDLGVEMGYAELAGLQKQIIQEARHQNRVVIMATQMMESMIVNSIPTRAEVSDVANAVMDGTDAVMLSAETASGKHPPKVVEAMAQIIVGAEKYQGQHVRIRQRTSGYFGHTDEAIASAVMYTANHLHVKAIVALTESGSTSLWMSRVRSDIPIYAFTRHESTRSRVCLYRGVYPVAYDVTHLGEAFYFSIFRVLLDHKLVEEGDSIILTKGELTGVAGGTNSMQILKVARG
ncbi:MAG TPA: pyruvate kinase [Steroidobacteraceae bacterium]|jgi:pyruvate kinase|nr:pyruvate kinase [Steroidobacteraceae bacterium]